MTDPTNGTGAVDEVLRTMALIDEVIGLRAELAELRHRLELSGVPTEAADTSPGAEAAAEIEAAARRTGEALARAEVAEAALAAVLGSRSWRIGQRVVGAAGPLSQVLRRR